MTPPRAPVLALLLAVAAVPALGCVEADRTSDAALPPLRVCADPNNLPFSNEQGEGLENRLAELLADDLGMELQYTWWPQRRGFIRNTLQADLCDVVLSAPVGFDPVMTTAPYYTSTYVAIWRADRGLAIASFDDPDLRTLRVAVQIVGDDGANPPPAHALASRGIVQNVVGFTVYGDYAEPNPPARIVDAVADGSVDVAFVWGPLAGYFAQHAAVPLGMQPITGDPKHPELPLSYAIAAGVRRGDTELRDRLDEALTRRRADVEALLTEYGVPRVP